MLREKKIKLRTLLPTDLEFLQKIENDRSLWEYGSDRKIFTKKELTNYIKNSSEKIQKAKQFRFVVDYNNTPVGFVDLFEYKNNSAGVGIIIDKEYQKRGFALESLKLLIDYSLEKLKLKILHCKISKCNFRSIQLFTSCGFIFTKEMDNLYFYTFTL
ncbi:MAG: GNAT family N-acetyltransferase [Flavobacteriales bacterium]|jgi:diamine N-acetyltransferase|nr:GNAT family N-acetyltransferase [Flavobacteriales bacterium]MBT5699566.1 GNAT family N-acetyltransferase [Flavobacteriales bacterium]MBT6815294.1 GNAT family N-acetyltransferase [Flavobacteriales bacterium]